MKKLLILLISLILLTSCSTKDKSKVLVGIIRVPNDTVVAIEKGWIEEEFKELGLEVEFRFFDSGVAMNQAFASGALDIAEMGFTNGVVALSRKLPVELFWIHDIIRTTEALVVRDENIIDLTELKGKKIATVFSSTSHLSLLKALEIAGLTSDDVTLLNMETAEIVAAWKRGDIDAAYTWEPTLSTIKEEGKIFLTSETLMQSHDGIMTTNIGLVHKDFASEHPEAVKAFIKSMDKAYKLRYDNLDEVVSLTAKYLGISEDLTRTQIEGSEWVSKESLVSDDFLNKDYIDVFVETSEFWEAQNFIDKKFTHEEVKNFINMDYINEVILDD